MGKAEEKFSFFFFSPRGHRAEPLSRVGTAQTSPINTPPPEDRSHYSPSSNMSSGIKYINRALEVIDRQDKIIREQLGSSSVELARLRTETEIIRRRSRSLQVCNACTKSFFDEKGLRRHIVGTKDKRHEDLRQQLQKLSCDYCGTEYPKRESVTRHMRHCSK